MLRAYQDIRSRIHDPILWWDDNGVPRYCEFRPQECGVYDVVVALIEVGCQACRQPFRVAVTFAESSLKRLGERYTLPTAGDIGSFHYGDPPSHSHDGVGCTGNTMLSESIRVLEFWQSDWCKWVRRPEYEVYIGEHDHEGPTIDDL